MLKRKKIIQKFKNLKLKTENFKKLKLKKSKN